MRLDMPWSTKYFRKGGLCKGDNYMEFSINGINWTMEYADSDKDFLNDGDNTILGLTKFLEQTIYIRKGMSKELTRRTVIHELCHCFLFSLGFSMDCYTEETMCDLFGNYADHIVGLADDFEKEVIEC